jgi:uncharacterized membrane protein YciS (DUF1049 family)
MRALKFVLFSVVAVSIAIIVVAFTWQNRQVIELNLFSYSTPPYPIAGHLLIAFLVGMVFCALLISIPVLQMKTSTSGLRKQIKKYEKELQLLRNQPLDEIPQNKSVEVAKLVEPDDEPQKPYLQSP